MAHETACSVRKSRLLVDGKYTVAECLPVSGVAHVCVTRQNACDHVYLFVFLCFRIKSARNTTIKEHTQKKKTTELIRSTIHVVVNHAHVFCVAGDCLLLLFSLYHAIVLFANTINCTGPSEHESTRACPREGPTAG